MADGRPVIIGLAGGTGSGKTTVTEALLQHLGERAVLLQHDWYYRDQRDRSPEERAQVNYDHPDAQETDLLVAHVDALHAGQAIKAPQYDFATHTRTDVTRTIPARPVVVVEGINTLANADLRARCDLTVYVDTPADVRFARRLQRDVAERGRTAESVVSQYLEHVRPMHEAYVEPCKGLADVVVSGEDDVAESVAAICARLASLSRDSGRILLLSNSTMAGAPYLEWARPHILEALHGVKEVLFVPYAAVDISYNEYTERVQAGLHGLGAPITGLHTLADPRAALAHAEAVMVGGGNTFCLLAACQRERLLTPLRAAVRRGAAYVGWSAGSNLACPTIKTTNDMPVEAPSGLDALGLVPFQINPHYTAATVEGHGGESRDQRLKEFTVRNPELPVLALPEGMYVDVQRGQARLGGHGEAKWLRGEAAPKRVLPDGLVDWASAAD